MDSVFVSNSDHHRGDIHRGDCHCSLFGGPRQAVWAVNVAKGTVSIIQRPTSKRSQENEDDLPEFVRPAWRWSEIAFKEWLPQDNRVNAVTLSNSTVDHIWLSHLQPMVSLQILSLNSKQIGPGLAALETLAKLTDVKVLNADAETRLENMLSLPSLKRLSLVNPKPFVHGFSELGKHPSLRDLELVAMNPESSGWAILLHQCRDWTNIDTISIRSVDSLTPGLEALQFCASLRSLEISAPVTHSDLVALSAIEQISRLVLNANLVGKDDLLLLKNLRNLRSLKIYCGGDEKLLVR